MKTCTKCQQSKPSSEFYKESRTVDGLRSACKVCTRQSNNNWKASNRQHCAEYQRQYAKDNPEIATRYSKTPKGKATRKKYLRDNAARFNAYNNKRKADLKARTFGDPADIQYVYHCADVIHSVYGGTKPHVDHIVPRKGKNVCGLHAPWNLQLLSARENMSKSNRHTD